MVNDEEEKYGNHKIKSGLVLSRCNLVTVIMQSSDWVFQLFILRRRQIAHFSPEILTHTIQNRKFDFLMRLETSAANCLHFDGGIQFKTNGLLLKKKTDNNNVYCLLSNFLVSVGSMMVMFISFLDALESLRPMMEIN